MMLNNDLITKQVAQMLSLPEAIIDTVMLFEKKSVKEATEKHNSVEITGMGKLKVRPKQLIRRSNKLASIISAYENQQKLLSEDDPKWKSLQYRINQMYKELSYLETKM